MMLLSVRRISLSFGVFGGPCSSSFLFFLCWTLVSLLIRFQLFVGCGIPTEGCATVSVAMSGAWWGLSDAGSGSSDKICCRG
jgi:hypothetical protein